MNKRPVLYLGYKSYFVFAEHVLIFVIISFFKDDTYPKL